MDTAAGRDLDRWSKDEASATVGLSKHRYVPPASPGEIGLWAALAGTNRISDHRQLSLPNEAPSAAIPDTRLFYAGDLSLLQLRCVAIVGTREVTEDGRRRTQRLAHELAIEGVAIVSGLAYGVDAVAHRSAIDAGGKTIAVIGTPLDRASPSENAELQEQIYRDHLLVSRFPSGTKTQRSDFPLRNRLMAGLSDATVVMEASDTSGTLHQAAECTKIGRWLFIAKSVVEDRRLTWPAKFLKYETCVPLEHISDILTRIR